MSPEVVALVGVGGTLVGIIAGRFAIRSGLKEQLADDVIANDKIRTHIKGIANDSADKRIDAVAEKRKWLDARDHKAINDRFDRVDESIEDLHKKIDNGLADRIAKQVADIFKEDPPVYVNEPGPHIHTRKTRRRSTDNP